MNEKYDNIGLQYNQTRKADKYLTDRLFRNLNPNSNGLYLDIGCGTGNYTHELSKKGIPFIGIDPSELMLKHAQLKNKTINWRLGTAEETGLESESVDGVIAGLTIHHWDDIEKGFAEMFRILKPTGTIVIFTSTPNQMKGYWLNYYFPKMLEASMKQMPSFQKVEQAMNNVGFKITKTENYEVKTTLEDGFLYIGKNNPALYLDKKIRNGISSFQLLSNEEEVKLGLKHLQADIDNGDIKSVLESYQNDNGDYLYIVGKKPK